MFLQVSSGQPSRVRSKHPSPQASDLQSSLEALQPSSQDRCRHPRLTSHFPVEGGPQHNCASSVRVPRKLSRSLDHIRVRLPQWLELPLATHHFLVTTNSAGPTQNFYAADPVLESRSLTPSQPLSVLALTIAKASLPVRLCGSSPATSRTMKRAALNTSPFSLASA